MISPQRLISQMISFREAIAIEKMKELYRTAVSVSLRDLVGSSHQETKSNPFYSVQEPFAWSATQVKYQVGDSSRCSGGQSYPIVHNEKVGHCDLKDSLYPLIQKRRNRDCFSRAWHNTARAPRSLYRVAGSSVVQNGQRSMIEITTGTCKWPYKSMRPICGAEPK